ncbi:hypothetical protein F53441_11027 [Fusarium austroafricanum]|uniref:Uncharacterized protein n=1 Tax=Fusarium austroafricanum TaxID=2364996 RepID=A0A8H4P1A5_9HYPO|nr:hypothetical protein F53441_11027 [Fusarium austroafricanum]
MTTLNTTESSCTFGDNLPLVDPQLAEHTGALVQEAFGQSGSPQEDFSFAKASHAEKKLEEQGIQIDILKLKVKRCEELLRERDSTIETQRFHIGILYGDVCRLTNEKEGLETTVMSLRNQFKDFEKNDWQLYSGVGKKRKFIHEAN